MLELKASCAFHRLAYELHNMNLTCCAIFAYLQSAHELTKYEIQKLRSSQLAEFSGKSLQNVTSTFHSPRCTSSIRLIVLSPVYLLMFSKMYIAQFQTKFCTFILLKCISFTIHDLSTFTIIRNVLVLLANLQNGPSHQLFTNTQCWY